MTLIEALARAGSTTEHAAGEALIVRSSDGSRSSGPVLPDQKNGADVIRVDIKAYRVVDFPKMRLSGTATPSSFPRRTGLRVRARPQSGGLHAASGVTVLQALSLAGGSRTEGQ